MDKAKRIEEDKKHQIVSLDGQVQGRDVLKGWQRAPKVEMGVKTRRDVERLIRSNGVWNPNGVQLGHADAQSICDALARNGFRRSHEEEATEICKDKEECLEWLLIHVPESDMPAWALPEKYMAGVSLASGDLKKEGKIRRLAIAGYTPELCADILDECGSDESAAAEMLQQRLLVEDGSFKESAIKSDVWVEELEAIASILDDHFTNHDRI